MIFSSPFSSANFKDLEPGDFFFHPLDGGHSPALKVTRADGINSVVDLNCEQQNGVRLPTLMWPDAFEDITVIAVKSAIIRPKPDTNALINGAGAASSIDQSSLVMAPSGTLLKVKGPNLMHLVFNVETGVQSSNPDSVQCIWTKEWEVVIEQDDKTLVLFQRKP